MFQLTPRYYPLKPHPVQLAWMRSNTRFNVVPAGRRSGKTERAKRKVVRKALMPDRVDARFFLAAPTRDQAKRIYWGDIKAMIPLSFVVGHPRESDLSIQLVTGAEIWVIGLDKPERFEGTPWDGGVLDEYGNMKPTVWGENVRPALADRRGWCDLIGVPGGRNHYYDTYEKARSDDTGEWGAFTWKSADILDPEEIASAKRDLDPLTFEQEYEASFLNFSGRAYYGFDERINCSTALKYNPQSPLVVMFDFNVSPGVALIGQEQMLPSGMQGTAIIGEVYIPRNSNTIKVCNKIKMDWGSHHGKVICYGDATGGQRGSAKVAGSDWDLIRQSLKPVWGHRFRLDVPSQNPTERTRVNAMNTRLLSGDGSVRMMVNPRKAPKFVKDLEGVRVIEGGSGEIDKDSNKKLTHLTDAAGYYINRRFPIFGQGAQHRELPV